MMCAFMTPVLKNDWELFDNKQNKVTTKGRLNQSASAPQLMTREQKLQRLREIQETRRLLLQGKDVKKNRKERSNSCSVTDSRGYHRNGQSLSVSNSRNHLPISPLALQQNNHSIKTSSNSSLNKFHSKVLDKLKDVFSSKPQEEPQTKAEETSPPQRQRQIQIHRRISRSRVSSICSFECPKIKEEEEFDLSEP